MSNATVKSGKKLAAQKLFKSYEFSLFCALVLIFVVSALSHKYFLTVTNIMNIGLAAAVSGTMAAGLTMYMLIGALDMSQYPIAALSCTIMGICNIKWGLNVWVSLAICLVIATILGAINGTLLLAKIPPVIVTLGTMNVYRGLAYACTNARNIILYDTVFKTLGQHRIGGILPVPFLIMLLTFGLFWFILNKTKFGRQVYATGANPRAAHLAGIPVQKIRFIATTVAGTFAGLAGILAAGQAMAVLPATGVGSEVEISTACMVGGLSMGGGKGKIIGCFLGLMILMVINNILVLHSVPSYWQQVVRGAVLVIAVAIDTVRGGGFNDRS